MENRCPVHPQKIKISDQINHRDALTKRAELIANTMTKTDTEAAECFLRSFEYLKELGDPMMEWFITSRELGLSAKEESPKTQVTDETTAF